MRLYHRLYALFFGYFWLPCPLCKRNFGGHEIGEYGIPPKDEENGKCVCNDEVCQMVARALTPWRKI